MNQTLLEQYLAAMSTNYLYQRNEDQWRYELESYMGGIEYKRAGHLTRYVNETDREYQARVAATHLENHCRSVVSTYISFLFREEPKREFKDLEMDPMLKDFLEDADLDGRNFDAFMKEVAVWNSVFGHSWVLVVKPNVGALTMADEVAQGARPYVSLLTPLAVMDWTWRRLPNGRYELIYFKYAEEANDSFTTVKEWTKDTIKTTTVSHKDKKVVDEYSEVNGINAIPAVLSYNHRSPVRGIGVSDINDIADAQRFVYNLTSEVEQSVRINGHPTVVKTPDVEMSAGAGSIALMPDNMDPGLKPYMMTVSTNIDSIYNAISHTISAIDKMANTGSIRSTEATRMSGVAQEQEFQLLNAKLSEKADNIELTEEAIWEWFCMYQGKVWTGCIEYPGSFNIRDTQAEIDQLVKAKNAATDPRVLAVIDHEIIECLGEDADLIMPEMVNDMPLDAMEPFEEPEELFNPQTGETVWAVNFEEKQSLLADGWVCKE